MTQKKLLQLQRAKRGWDKEMVKK